MIPMTMAQIAAVTSGQLYGAPNLMVTGPAYLDSRDPAPGGHRYADHAHAVLGTRPTTRPTVVVPDVSVALGRLARHLIDQVDPTVIAVTGSHGKTGTKDYLAHLLPDVVATQGNQNNELGVPLTVLRMTSTDTRIVLEMGSRGVGQLTYLTDIAPPRVAALVSLGTAHLGQFGSAALLRRAKGELLEALPSDGVAVVPSADDQITSLPTRASRLTFGTSGDIWWREVTLDDCARPTFTLGYGGDRTRIGLPRAGIHQIANAAAAVALAVAAGERFDQVAPLLASAPSQAPHRMSLSQLATGALVIDDSYNANPTSMAAAIDVLASCGRRRGGRTWAVLGAMTELGPSSAAGHREVARLARRAGARLVPVGTDEYGAPGLELSEVVATIAGSWGPRDTVLIKGSRASRTDRLLDGLDTRPVRAEANHYI